MACTNCRSKCQWDVLGTCAVCALNNADVKERRVCYCDLCEAYICKKHWNDPLARTVAAAKTVVKKVRTRIKRIISK